MSIHEKNNYVEFPASDLKATKVFFSKVFGWTFEDFGEEYTAFYNQGLDGGFYQSEMKSLADKGAALVVFNSDDLEDSYKRVVDAGGKISTKIFSFPGGRRFHFIEPSGNEFAVWTKSE